MDADGKSGRRDRRAGLDTRGAEGHDSDGDEEMEEEEDGSGPGSEGEGDDDDDDDGTDEEDLALVGSGGFERTFHGQQAPGFQAVCFFGCALRVSVDTIVGMVRPGNCAPVLPAAGAEAVGAVAPASGSADDDDMVRVRCRAHYCMHMPACQRLPARPAVQGCRHPVTPLLVLGGADVRP